MIAKPGVVSGVFEIVRKGLRIVMIIALAISIIAVMMMMMMMVVVVVMMMTIFKILLVYRA